MDPLEIAANINSKFQKPEYIQVICENEKCAASHTSTKYKLCYICREINTKCDFDPCCEMTFGYVVKHLQPYLKDLKYKKNKSKNEKALCFYNEVLTKHKHLMERNNDRAL